MKHEEEYPKCKAPDGVFLPTDGQPFQRQATFKADADGMLILLAIDGYPLCQPDAEKLKPNVLSGRMGMQPEMPGY